MPGPNVGEQIRAICKARGLSLRAPVECSRLSTNVISLIERGESSPTAFSLHLLATALDMPFTNTQQAAYS